MTNRKRDCSTCYNLPIAAWLVAAFFFQTGVANANFFELEIEADELAELIRQNIVLEGFSLSEFCPQGYDTGIEVAIADDADYLEGAYFRPAPGADYDPEIVVLPPPITNEHPTQLVLPVVIGVKNQDNHYDPDVDIDSFDFEVSVNLIFALTASEAGVCFSFLNLESTSTLLDESYLSSVTDAIGGTNCIPVDLTDFNDFTSGLMPAHHGVSTDDLGERLAFRVEYSEDGMVGFASAASWISFYNEWSSSTTEEYDWNILFHKDLLKRNAEEMISSKIEATDDTWIDSIDSYWTPNGEDGGNILIDVDAFKHHWSEVCNPIEVDATVTMDLLFEDGSLVARGDVDPDVNLNLFCEIVTLGIVSWAIETFRPIPFDVEDCTSWDGGRKFKCVMPVSIPALDLTYDPLDYNPIGVLTGEEVRGEEDGLVLGGSYGIMHAISKERLSGSFIEPMHFGFKFRSCGDMECTTFGVLDLNGSGRTCGGIGMIDDPYSAYSLEFPWTDDEAIFDLPKTFSRVDVILDPLVTSFQEDPYPAHVYIPSTVGGHVFEDWPPEELPTPEEQDMCYNIAIDTWLSDCNPPPDLPEPPIFSFPWGVIDPMPEYRPVLDLSIYPSVESEQGVVGIVVNIVPVFAQGGEQKQALYESCSGSVTWPDGTQEQLEFASAISFLEESIEGSFNTAPEAKLRDLPLKGYYSVSVVCRLLQRDSEIYETFGDRNTFYYNPAAIPFCTSDDCDGDGIANEWEDGDADLDGWPDAFDDDFDNDGISDSDDNCPETWNEEQTDIDGDGIGDVCDCADPPIIYISGEEYRNVCLPHGGIIKIGMPRVFDTCTPQSAIGLEGYLISSNGMPVDSVPVLESGIFLPEGQNVVRWVATDELGNMQEAFQNVNVIYESSEECCGDRYMFIGDDFFNMFRIEEEPACVMTYGGPDIVYLTGYADDYIVLGEGNDAIHARGGESVIIAGEGNDTIFFDCGGTIYGEEGNDKIVCYGFGDAVVYGGTGKDIIRTQGGNDMVMPGAGRDYVWTGNGDDQILFYAACELENRMVINGGEGEDTLYLPEGIMESDLVAMDIDVIGIENYGTVGANEAGFADCE